MSPWLFGGPDASIRCAWGCAVQACHWPCWAWPRRAPSPRPMRLNRLTWPRRPTPAAPRQQSTPTNSPSACTRCAGAGSRPAPGPTSTCVTATAVAMSGWAATRPMARARNGGAAGTARCHCPGAGACSPLCSWPRAALPAAAWAWSGVSAGWRARVWAHQSAPLCEPQLRPQRRLDAVGGLPPDGVAVAVGAGGARQPAEPRSAAHAPGLPWARGRRAAADGGRAAQDRPGGRAVHPAPGLVAGAGRAAHLCAPGLGSERQLRQPEHVAPVHGLAVLRGVVPMNPIADDPSPLALHVQALLQRETGQVLSPAGLSELMALTGHGGASAWSDPVQQREVTVVLADLRGFTALTATQPAGVIIALLNRCLAVLSEVILRHGGTIDKFMGDSVMALFGAPQGRPDDVERALVCAVEMQLAMAVLNREGSQQGLPELYMGIGINTGQVIAGRFGSAAYSQYTVIGDEVNLASRIESFSLRGQVLVSEHTYQRCAHLVEASGPMEVHVKGKSEAVRVREVVAIPSRGLHVPRAEVRRSHRVEVRLPCTLHELKHKVVLPHPMAAVIIDVGYHGLQIELDQPLEPFAELKLEFALLLVDFTVSDVYAKVVKCRPCEGRWRAGLEFTAIGVESSARLQTFVQLLVAVR